MCDWGEDGAQGLKTHGYVQEMGSKEEVVIVTQNWHGHVPRQIQEGLQQVSKRQVSQDTVVSAAAKLQHNWQL